MVVYVEYVLIDNVLIDYLLLKATFEITNLSVKKGRLFLLAVFGGAFSLTYPLLQNFNVLLTVIKVLFGLLLVLIASNYKSVKSYYINVLVFFSLTFLTGGAIIGLSNLLGVQLGTEFCIATIVLPAYLVIKGIKEVIQFLYKRKEITSFIYNIEINLNGKSIVAKGFLDTGNGLYYNNEPVIICNKKLFFTLIGNQSLPPKIEKIECQTVGGKSTLLAVKIDGLKIYFNENLRIFNNVVMAISKVDNLDYQVILHPAFMEENYVSSNRKVKKVS